MTKEEKKLKELLLANNINPKEIDSFIALAKLKIQQNTHATIRRSISNLPERIIFFHCLVMNNILLHEKQAFYQNALKQELNKVSPKEYQEIPFYTDERISCFKFPDGRTRTDNRLILESQKNGNLANQTTYDIYGKIVEKWNYDISFIRLIKDTKPIYKIQDLLEAQFKKCKNQGKFKQHIEFEIKKNLDKTHSKQVDIWLNETKDNSIIKDKKEEILYNWEQMNSELIKKGFIEEDTGSMSLKLFFDNKTLDKKIIWIDKATNHTTTKGSLFVLIKTIKPNLINDEEKKNFYSMIENNFTDKNNTMFNYNSLKSSFSAWLKRTTKNGLNKRESLLKSIIETSKQQDSLT